MNLSVITIRLFSMLLIQYRYGAIWLHPASLKSEPPMQPESGNQSIINYRTSDFTFALNLFLSNSLSLLFPKAKKSQLLPPKNSFSVGNQQRLYKRKRALFCPCCCCMQHCVPTPELRFQAYHIEKANPGSNGAHGRRSPVTVQSVRSRRHASVSRVDSRPAMLAVGSVCSRVEELTPRRSRALDKYSCAITSGIWWTHFTVEAEVQLYLQDSQGFRQVFFSIQAASGGWHWPTKCGKFPVRHFGNKSELVYTKFLPLWFHMPQTLSTVFNGEENLARWERGEMVVNAIHMQVFLACN